MFRYVRAEIEAIQSTLWWPLEPGFDLTLLEQCAERYLFRVARARSAAPLQRVKKEKADRDRSVERVRRAIHVGQRAERVSQHVNHAVANDNLLSRTRLLAEAMFKGKIDEWELRALIARDLLAEPNRLVWPGDSQWTFSDGRKKDHRTAYIDELVRFWAEDRDIRPDQVSVSPVESQKGNRLMDFLLAAGSRPMNEAGELIGPERITDVVEGLKRHWAGIVWEENL